MIFISVNTPNKTTGIGSGMQIDLKWVEASTRKIADHAKKHTIVVEKAPYQLEQQKQLKIFLNHLVKINLG